MPDTYSREWEKIPEGTGDSPSGGLQAEESVRVLFLPCLPPSSPKDHRKESTWHRNEGRSGINIRGTDTVERKWTVESEDGTVSGGLQWRQTLSHCS